MGKDAQILSKLLKRMKAEQNPLDPLIDAYMMNRERSSNRLPSYTIEMEARPRPPGRISPSTIYGCKKMATFKFLGAPGRKRIDPDLEGIFDDGNWRHHRLQANALDMERVLGKKKFQVVSIEEDITIPELYIAGSLDLYCRINRERWVLDYKGINDWGFSDLMKRDEPKEEHVHQLITYMRAKRCPRGMLYYENKNDQRRRIYVVRFDQEEWDRVKEWTVDVLRSMQRRELPEMHPDCEAGTYLWERCPWAGLCYGNLDRMEQEELAYNGFQGIDKQWEAGNREASAV